MKTRLSLAVLLLCAAPIWAQPQPKAGAEAGADLAPPVAPELPLLAPDEATRLVVKKPLVLRLRENTLLQALEQLQAQSGVQFNIGRISQPELLDTKLSLDLETLGFEEAFDCILDAAGVPGYLGSSGTERPLGLIYGSVDPYLKLPSDRRGLFVARLRALNSTLSETVNLSARPKPTLEKNNHLNALVLVYPDLRLPVAGAPSLRATLALDDQGRSLLLDDKPDDGAFFDAGDVRKDQQKPLRLARPAPDARRLARLEGVATFVLATKTERWEVPDVLAQPEWTHAFQSNGQQIELRARASPQKEGAVSLSLDAVTSAAPRAGARPLPLFSTDRLMQSVTLEDAQGYILRGRGDSGSLNRERTQINVFSTLRLTGERNPAFATPDAPTQKLGEHQLVGPLKFVFETPTEWIQTQVPFAFSDLPLPQTP